MKRVKYKDPDLVQVFLGFSKHVKKLQTSNTKTSINKFSVDSTLASSNNEYG